MSSDEISKIIGSLNNKELIKFIKNPYNIRVIEFVLHAEDCKRIYDECSKIAIRK